MLLKFTMKKTILIFAVLLITTQATVGSEKELTTMLRLAINGGKCLSIERIRELLRKGADPFAITHRKNTLLSSAIKRRRQSIPEAMIEEIIQRKETGRGLAILDDLEANIKKDIGKTYRKAQLKKIAALKKMLQDQEQISSASATASTKAKPFRRCEQTFPGSAIYQELERCEYEMSDGKEIQEALNFILDKIPLFRERPESDYYPTTAVETLQQFNTDYPDNTLWVSDMIEDIQRNYPDLFE